MAYYIKCARDVKRGDILALPGIRPGIVTLTQNSMYGPLYINLRDLDEAGEVLVHDYLLGTQIRMFDGEYPEVLARWLLRDVQ